MSILFQIAQSGTSRIRVGEKTYHQLNVEIDKLKRCQVIFINLVF